MVSDVNVVLMLRVSCEKIFMEHNMPTHKANKYFFIIVSFNFKTANIILKFKTKCKKVNYFFEINLMLYFEINKQMLIFFSTSLFFVVKKC